ncbi:MAG: hypothetical protein ACAI25_14880 [Planctomycetota bacterium]
MPDPVIDATQLEPLTDKAQADAALRELVKDFTQAKVYRTRVVVTAYQPGDSKGVFKSKLWLPSEPKEKPVTKAEIPKGTTVVVGFYSKTTQWHVPDTFGAKGAKPGAPPMSWKLKVVSG